MKKINPIIMTPEMIANREIAQKKLNNYSQHLNDSNDQMRLNAVMGIANLGKHSAKIMPDLLNLLDDKNDEVRSMATYVVVNICVDILETPEEYYPNKHYYDALKLIPMIVHKLAELKNDPNSDVREWANNGVESLGRFVTNKLDKMRLDKLLKNSERLHK